MTFEELAELFKNPDYIGEIPVISKFKLPWLVRSKRLTLEQYEELLIMAITNINNQIPLNEEGVQYADLQSQESWQIDEKIRRIESLIPEDGLWSDKLQIHFSKRQERRGITAIYFASGIMGTDVRGIRTVSNRTALILRLLKIPYMSVE